METQKPTPMTFEDFSKANRARCESPQGFNHRLGSWTLSDWMTATAGELGEAANVVKKLNRYRDGINGNTESEWTLREKLKREIADTFIYLDLMAQAAGISLGQAVAITFDEKSMQIGYPHSVGGVDGAYSLGEIVRYGDGPTALMQIDHIAANGRFYGTHVLGGGVGASRDQLRIATNDDLNTWTDNYNRRNGVAEGVAAAPKAPGAGPVKAEG